MADRPSMFARGSCRNLSRNDFRRYLKRHKTGLKLLKLHQKTIQTVTNRFVGPRLRDLEVKKESRTVALKVQAKNMATKLTASVCQGAEEEPNGRHLHAIFKWPLSL